MAVEGLNGMQVGDQAIRVQRASIGVTQAAGLEMGVNAMSMLAGTTSNDLEEGRVLQLLNMVTPEELIDNEDYEGMFSSGVVDWEAMVLIFCFQRSSRTSERNARNMAPFSKSKSPAPLAAAGSRLAWARSISNTIMRIRRGRRSRPWRVGSLPIVRL